MNQNTDGTRPCVKGTTFVARRHLICKLFGEERWAAFLARVVERDPFFDAEIYVTSRIPLDKFLRFQDALMAEFFDDSVGALERLGEIAAGWALTEGPHAHLVERSSRDIRAFLESSPTEIWDRYFDFGRMTVRTEPAAVEVIITGLPSDHGYFEHSLVGYMRHALELFGAGEVRRCEARRACLEERRFRFEHTPWPVTIPPQRPDAEG